MANSNEYMANYMRERYKRDIEWVRRYKVEHGCFDCGYNAHHAGLEFDHRIPRAITGDPTITQVMGRGLNSIKREIAKCDVVCGTCHSVRTWNRQQEENQAPMAQQVALPTLNR